MGRKESMEAEMVADILLMEHDSENDEYPAFSETRLERRERDREKLLERADDSDLAALGAQTLVALADKALTAVCHACSLGDCEVECVTYRLRRGLTIKEIAEIIKTDESCNSCSHVQVGKCLERLLARIYNHPTFWTYTVIAEECRLPPNTIRAICEDW